MFTDFQTWAINMAAEGRVVTRMPSTVSSTLAGQLASRLAVADPSLGTGPAQWDYQLAPLSVRAADNLDQLGDQYTLINAWMAEHVDDIRQAFGDQVASAVENTVSLATSTAGDVATGIAKGLGVTGWVLVAGVVALGVVMVGTERGRHTTRRLAGAFV